MKKRINNLITKIIKEKRVDNGKQVDYILLSELPFNKKQLEDFKDFVKNKVLLIDNFDSPTECMEYAYPIKALQAFLSRLTT